MHERGQEPRVAVSPLHIVLAQWARFYTMFFASYLAALLLFLRLAGAPGVADFVLRASPQGGIVGCRCRKSTSFLVKAA